ncbi:molybdate ABC transporter substrate-binding protein [Collinsella sp. An2]|uniref:molybdate ABC transporter substrate-binding protein n=1 Tax=Collinsella sp. An2 TaxID=1965585 RepID=UPI000B36750D|nr:molybdate ABC transporter substrate-binding protein [Collinsella sp. An2]OUP08680.1 molybdate ABC transporter substrate-binding protein [Collinsella sp. An2]
MFDHMMSRRTLIKSGAAAAAAGMLAGCNNDAQAPTGSAGSSKPTATDGDAVELQIFAANSLEKAMPKVQELFTDETGTTFADTQFRGSGDLVEQMTAGAQVDVLITASAGTMDDAEDGELVDPDTRVDMFVNDLVIVAAQDSDITIDSLEDIVNIDGNIAIGEPGAVPAGKYANQSLASVGLYSDDSGANGVYDASIADRVNQANSVGTAAQYVSSGECVIGFVYTSDVYRYDGLKVVYTVPAEAHSAIVYPGAVATTSKNPDVAQDFITFCMENEDALAIWSQYGFELAK